VVPQKTIKIFYGYDRVNSLPIFGQISGIAVDKKPDAGCSSSE